MHSPESDCLQRYFAPFRENITGIDARIPTPYGEKPLIYTDWTASGRLYTPIEKHLSEQLGAYMANTHTETSYTGKTMTRAYHRAREIIRRHLNAGDDYVLLQAGYGMTGAVNKLQRILGLRVHEAYEKQIRRNLNPVPVVFVSRMEHHSNHISWMETLADVELIPFNDQGFPDASAYEELLRKHRNRPLYLSITACSNVTGLTPDLKTFIRLTHRYGGRAFVDYACSAPYTDIDLSGDDQILPDAVMFSPHKFLGGPGSGGILVMKKDLYRLHVPDQPGGGTVVWTDPWEGAVYFDDIEMREDGGTPGFLQMIRTSMAILLKEEMDTGKIQKREHEILERLITGLESIPGIRVLEGRHKERFGVVSFVSERVPYGLMNRLLNDLFGIQARGGCSCAGTYGHYLFGLDRQESARLKSEILRGNTDNKPGWTRVSIHPTTTNDEVETVLEAVEYIQNKGLQIAEKDYVARDGNYFHRDFDYAARTQQLLQKVFTL